MKHQSLFIGFAVGMVSTARGAETPLAPLGVVVRFAPQTTNALREALHRECQTQLQYRSDSRLYDVVKPLDAARAQSLTDLVRLCGAYLKSTLVASCEANQVLTLAEPDHGSASPVTPADFTSNRCELVERTFHGRAVPNLMGGTLSPFWAQEYIGADLARNALERYQEAPGTTLPTTSVGIVDRDYALFGRASVSLHAFPESALSDELRSEAAKQRANLGKSLELRHDQEFYYHNQHATPVAHLIAGETPVGVGTQIRIDVVQALGRTEDLIKGSDQIQRSKAKVVNMSASAGEYSLETRRILNELAREGTLLVVASGNDFPKPMEYNETQINAVLVGSQSPLGLVSGFSQSSPKVTITAPSDVWLQSIGHVSNSAAVDLVAFSGTSGAAPLVTGALASYAVKLLPDLQPEEARILLQKTAVQTFDAREPAPQNGAGMLNAYKLLEVSKRLKERNFSHLSPRDRKNLLTGSALYDFSQKFSAADTAARKADLLSKTAPCERRRQALTTLREQFLLTQSRASADALSAFYVHQGLSTNAAFYGGLGSGGIAVPLKAASEAKGLGSYLGTNLTYNSHLSAARAAIAAGPAGYSAIVSLLKAPPESKYDSQESMKALETSVPNYIQDYFYNQDGFPASLARRLVEAVKYDPENRVGFSVVGRALADYLRKAPTSESAPYLRRLFASDNPEMRQLVSELNSRSAKPDIELIRKALQNTDETVLNNSLEGIRALPRAEAVTLIGGWAASQNETLRKNSLTAATFLGAPFAAPYVRRLFQDPVPSVRQETLRHLEAVPDDEAAKMVQTALKDGDPSVVSDALLSGLKLKGHQELKSQIARLGIESSSFVTRQGVVEALKNAGSFAAPFLEEIMDREKEDIIRNSALQSARAIGPAGLPTLRKGLKDSEASNRSAAIYLAADLAPQVQMEFCRSGIKDPQSIVQTAALERSYQLGTDGLAIIRDALQTGSTQVRLNAAYTLIGHVKDRAALALLKEYALDSDDYIRGLIDKTLRENAIL